MFVVDTNILLHAVNPDSTDHERARTLVERWRSEGRPWFLTWGIAYDLHTAALMKEHGVTEIRTADTDFHQFPFLEVLNPLVEG